MGDKPFTNSNNVYLTRELFLETATDKSKAVFTLQNEDIPGYPSLYKVYMETGDPTEYRFAIQALGGWQHWEVLSKSAVLRDHVQKWREELEVKVRSQALASIMEAASKNTRDAFQANKYIVDRKYDNPRQTKGRPKKEDIAREASRIAQDKQREDDDYSRIVN